MIHDDHREWPIPWRHLHDPGDGQVVARVCNRVTGVVWGFFQDGGDGNACRPKGVLTQTCNCVRVDPVTDGGGGG